MSSHNRLTHFIQLNGSPADIRGMENSTPDALLKRVIAIQFDKAQDGPDIDGPEFTSGNLMLVEGE